MMQVRMATCGGEASDARAAAAAQGGGVGALSWWTFSSIFEEGALPSNEFGPFGANAAMQTVHGVPLPVLRRASNRDASGSLCCVASCAMV